MKISVVIPAYNEEKYIDQCLTSLEKQTRKPDEIIVVDNASKDKTATVAKKHNVTVIFESKKGVSNAIRKGFDKASGDVILRTDADTIVPSNWVEKMEKGFSNKNASIVCGGVVYYNRFLNPLSHFLIFWIDDIFGYKAVTGPNFGVRKSVWNKIKNELHTNDQKFHDDLDLAIHAKEHGEYVRDYTLMVESSSRKFSDTKTFFIKYPKKSFHTLFLKEHRKLSINPLMKHI